MRRLATIACVMMVAGCSSEQSASSAVSGQSPEAACASAETVSQLKSMIFDSAGSMTVNDQVKMNDLERESSASISMPLLQSHDEALDRTTCTGRLRIDLPVGTQSIFRRDHLLADLTYSMQPAADGSGLVYQVVDFGSIDSALSAADLSLWIQSSSRAPSQEPAPGRTFNASFDCSKAATRVERMICSDEELAELDQLMGLQYSQVIKHTPEAREGQREWLKERNACGDKACLLAAYRDVVREE